MLSAPMKIHTWVRLSLPPWLLMIWTKAVVLLQPHSLSASALSLKSQLSMYLVPRLRPPDRFDRTSALSTISRVTPRSLRLVRTPPQSPVSVSAFQSGPSAAGEPGLSKKNSSAAQTLRRNLEGIVTLAD